MDLDLLIFAIFAAFLVFRLRSVLGRRTVGILPRLKQFTIAGIFKAGHFEYDSSLVLIHIVDAQKLYRMKGGLVSGVRLKLHDLFQAIGVDAVC